MGTWPGLLLSSKSPASRKLVPTQVFLHFIVLLERLHPVAVYPLSFSELISCMELITLQMFSNISSSLQASRSTALQSCSGARSPKVL